MSKTITMPPDVAALLHTLNQNGYEAYIVGGCVRDAILSRVPQDWDITTSALPEQTKALFAHTFDTGIQHGTITVVVNHVNYEVTTYRIDGAYEDGRHPTEVSFTPNLEEDLLRRDFTMNAIAYHPQEGFRDPFCGQEDIARQCIRGVGAPAKRFQEDALRMLRCVRFAAQLGFWVEEETYHALQENAVLIEKISVERIHEELDKLWCAQYLEKLPLLAESGLLPYIDAVFAERFCAHVPERITQLQRLPNTPVLRWTTVLQEYTPDEAKVFCKKLKFDNNTMKQIMTLLSYIWKKTPETPTEVRTIAGVLGLELLDALFTLQEVLCDAQAVANARILLQEVLAHGDCLNLKMLEVDGKMLKEAGIPAGKTLGILLGRLLEDVLEHPAHNNQEYLLSLAAELQKEIQ